MSVPMPPGLFRHRLMPPMQHVTIVERAPRIPILQRPVSTPLCFVCGPAGFGKTALLTELYRDTRQSGAPAAWLSLDAGDADPARLLTSLAWALHHAGYDLAGTGLLEEASGVTSVDRFVEQLLPAIGSPVFPLTILLDDGEHIAGTPVVQLVIHLATSLAARLRFIIATCLPWPSSAGLYARGLATEVSADQLRLSPYELRSLLQAVSDTDAEAIDEATAGWPVAAQMIRLSMLEGRSVDEALKQIGAPGSALESYIDTHLLAKLPRDLESFLIHSASLDWIDPESATVLAAILSPGEHVGGLRSLAGLLRGDSDRGWRIVPLLQRHLLRLLRGKPPKQRAEPALALAQLSVQRSAYRDAVRLAVTAGDIPFATAVIKDAGFVRVWIRFGYDHVRAILDALPPEVVAADSRLQIGQIITLFNEGRVSAGRQLLQALRSSRDADISESAGEARKLYAELVGVEMLALIHEDVTTGEQLAEIERTYVRGFAADFDEFETELGCFGIIVHMQWGHFAEAERRISVVREAASRCNSAFTDYFLELYEGMIAFARGQVGFAIDHYRSAEALIGKSFEGDSGTMRCLHEILLAEAWYARGDIGTARSMLDAVLRVQPHSIAWYDFQFAAYDTAIRVALADGNIDLALVQVEGAGQEARRREAHGFVRVCALLKLLVLVRARRWGEAQTLVAEHEMEATALAAPRPRASHWRERELLLATLAEFAIGTGRTPLARELILALRTEAREIGRPVGDLRAQFLLAMLFLRQGVRDQAMAVMSQALAASATGDQGWIAEEYAPSLRSILAEYLDMATPRTEAQSSLHARLSRFYVARTEARSPLSDRERQILSLVSLGDSNKHIARRLGVSENTVKFHLKRVAAKLDAVGAGRMVLVQIDLSLQNSKGLNSKPVGSFVENIAG